MGGPAAVVAADESVIETMDEITASNVIEYAYVDGFKPGQRFRIGSISAGDFIEWAEANKTKAERTAGLRLITRSLVSKSGIRYADDPKNIAVFAAVNHKVTERIVKEILKLNGIKVKGVNEEKEETAEKND